MALTDIARQLKETFDGFGVSEHQADVERFRKIYGDAECIHIGEMDYIVINQAYDTEENADVPENVSPLFFSSLNQKYAIIDAQTSSTLIDEVYSRITYMQRVCNIDVLPREEEIQESLSNIIGEDVSMTNVIIRNEGEDVAHKANIFQCQLIKDTGVSASPDVYSFMLKNGEIKEVSESIVRQIRHMGEVNILEDRDELEQNNTAIQQAVFDKYINADMDIQSITVKSIFEISMPFMNILLFLRDGLKHNGVFRTVYLASENNEFDALNTSIQACNICEKDLTDLRDPTQLNKLHVNTDAYDEMSNISGSLNQSELTYAVGCEDCLEQCPDCGGWHFNYKKFIGSRIYEKVNLVPGRGFIRGLRDVEGVNYCACREGTEWIYDEESGTDTEHDVIKMENIAFLNCANEMIASYSDYAAFREKEERNAPDQSVINTREFAMRTLARFKKNLASKFEIDSREIKASSVEKCCRCSVCGGKYYSGNVADDYEYRCDVCDEMLTEKRHMVARIDGMIFMYRKVNRKIVVKKYVMTKLGNLKLVSENSENISQDAAAENSVTMVTEVLTED